MGGGVPIHCDTGTGRLATAYLYTAKCACNSNTRDPTCALVMN